MDADISELQGKSFTCLDGCAMCCLCQPELTPGELATFKKHGLVAGLTRDHIQGYTTKEPTAIKLQGGTGACHFLEGRRCTIHELRPSFCSQFPVHVHALHRIQLNANLSCRGITDGGESLMWFGREVLDDIDEKMAATVLAETRECLKIFERDAKRAGVFQPTERLRETGRVLASIIGSPGGIGRVLAFADSSPDIGRMPLRGLTGLIESSEPPDDLADAATQGNYQQLELDNPAWLPVYVDEALRWRTYRAGGGNIEVMELQPDGTLIPELAIPNGEPGLTKPNDGALKVFRDYAELLNSRDQFLGYACHVCRDQDYGNDLMTVYIGVLATTVLDLWWRCGLVGRILGREKLDAELAWEGVRAFDMDCLDMPTVGTFF